MAYMAVRHGTQPDTAFLDDRLSYRARGVLARILFDQTFEVVGAQMLADHGREGREAMHSALRELETMGYLKRERERTELGTFVHAVYVDFTPSDAADPTPGN